MATAWRQFLRYRRTSASSSTHSHLMVPTLHRILTRQGFPPSPSLRMQVSTHPTPRVKVGVPEFLNGIGRGLEAHIIKIESEIEDFNKLLVTRTLGLKKLGIPCKHRKLILKYTHKYRLGLWRPRIAAPKA